MTVRCVALLSGGLDSMLAIRLMQQQGIEVEAVNFKTIFTCCQDQAGQAARDLGVRLTVLKQEDDYLELLRYPKFGYGKGANPCVDCRIYMIEKAKRFMEHIGARFIVTGEVVGQRPMSQKRHDLDVVEHHSNCDDLLLRPLSAKLMPPTLPEREGWVDRDKLYGFRGRSRKELIQLAKQLDLPVIPTPSTGCALTEPGFGFKVFDLLEHTTSDDRWEFELLKVGRHFRFNEQTKIVVGRNETENDQLHYMHQLPDARSSASLFPENFIGPRSLVIGPPHEEAIDFAAALILRYSKRYEADNAMIRVETETGRSLLRARPIPEALTIPTIATAPASAK